MKSEEIIMQELERDRIRREREQGNATADNQERSNVKFMISGEAPVLMSKACELLIKDLSFRAWQHTERNRRRTLQRQDLHAAVGESEVYDFLIDIVPRVQTPQAQAPPATNAAIPDMSIMQPGMTTAYHQMPQMANALNAASMQQTAQAMAASVAPMGTQPGTAPNGVPVPAGVVDSSGNPQSGMQGGMLSFVSNPTEALNHLAQWDPSQMTFQLTVPAPGQVSAPMQAPDGQYQQQQATASTHIPTSAMPPQQFQQQPNAKQEEDQQQQQMQQHQLQLPGQWMDPAALAGTATAPSAPAAGTAEQETPGV